MKPIVHTQNRCAIVYDAERIPDPDPALFAAEHWRQGGAVQAEMAGRGSTLFLETPFGPAVLRAYLRGGWPARLSRDHYWFGGWERSRPFREFRLLVRLRDAGLSVPAPLAAICARSGLGYQGAILLTRILDVDTLGGLVSDGVAGEGIYKAVGACIREFHRAGVHHADLNVNNILVRRQDAAVFLVDFDRCRFNPERELGGDANLARLQRSVRKHWPSENRAALAQAWHALIEGYRADD
jgi:3-deoxy-D-manno-octulosonic acid kinase